MSSKSHKSYHRTPIDNLERLQSKPRKSLHKDFKARVLSDDPYIVKIKNLLSDDEVEELLEMTKGKFKKSNVVIDGELTYSSNRTSSTAYLFKDGMPDQYSRNIEKIIERICYLVNCERSQLEVMAVRYKYKQKFGSHVDYFNDDEIGKLDNGGQRIGTFFVYLNTLHEGEGGTTEFIQQGIHSKPRKGDCVFFWDKNRITGKMDPRTEHAGNPVEKEGVIKYGLNIWIRSDGFY